MMNPASFFLRREREGEVILRDCYNTNMTIVRAHFDGRVFIPDGPVDLPVGKTFEFEVRETSHVDRIQAVGARIGEANGLPVVNVPPGTRVITIDDVRGAIV